MTRQPATRSLAPLVRYKPLSRNISAGEWLMTSVSLRFVNIEGSQMMLVGLRPPVKGHPSMSLLISYACCDAVALSR